MYLGTWNFWIGWGWTSTRPFTAHHKLGKCSPSQRTARRPAKQPYMWLSWINAYSWLY